MRHSSWEGESDTESMSLNDCRVRNYEEFSHLEDKEEKPKKIEEKGEDKKEGIKKTS